MCGFIAQLVEQRTGNAEVTGSNPVEALIFFRLLLFNCLNWKIYCDDHSSLSDTASVHTYIKKGDLGAISATEPSSAVPISKVERHTSVPHFGVFCILV